MSTIWHGICLSHNPPIEFDVGRDEIKRWETAVAEFRTTDHLHKHCDVVIGGYSYPLVSVVCPCEHRSPKLYGVEDLRLVLAAARAGVGSEMADWLRHNSCWTLERISKLFSEGTKGN